MNGFMHDDLGFVPFPETFDDLPRHVVARVFRMLDEPFLFSQKKILSFLVTPKRVARKLTDGDLTNLLPLLHKLLGSKLTKNPLKIVNHHRTVLQGPEDKLTDITLEEWIICGRLAEEYSEKADENTKNDLLAVLWRPQYPFWKRIFGTKERKELTEFWLLDGSVLMRKIPAHQKAAMLAFFLGSRDAICAENPDVFVKKEDSGGKNYDLTDLIADLSREYHKPPSDISGWRMDDVIFLLSKKQKHGRDT